MRGSQDVGADGPSCDGGRNSKYREVKRDRVRGKWNNNSNNNNNDNNRSERIEITRHKTKDKLNLEPKPCCKNKNGK
jgi:hypothetical protein